MNSKLDNIPSISFIDEKTLLDVRNEMIASFQSKYKEITGTTIELSLASPYRLIIEACALQIYQSMQYVDAAGKNNLLKYSYGNYLDNIGAFRGITRSQGQKAETTLRFSLASARASAVSIPLGTRMSVSGIFFATTEYAEIAIGSTYVDVPAECTSVGSSGNGFAIGEITNIVDSLPYVDHASNTVATFNGADVESDDDYAERIYLGPSNYSVAGPTEAYEYFVKEYSSDIADVKVTSPSAGNVDVRFVLDDGELPSATMIAGVLAYLTDKTRKPLTDNVTVDAPTTSAYDISVTYYINSSDSSIAASIQTAVTSAVSSYKVWQDSKIGRDINPDELIRLIINAGAKRAVVTTPVRTVVSATNIAHCGTVTVTYGGIEDD